MPQARPTGVGRIGHAARRLVALLLLVALATGSAFPLPAAVPTQVQGGAQLAADLLVAVGDIRTGVPAPAETGLRLRSGPWVEPAGAPASRNGPAAPAPSGSAPAPGPAAPPTAHAPAPLAGAALLRPFPTGPPAA